MAIAAYSDPEPTRIPGDFPRHPDSGAPYVASITKTRQPKGNKPELLAEAARRGLEHPAKITIAELHTLLGAEAADEMYGRPSSLGKQIENLTNLQKWSERAVALGIFIAPELLRPLVGLGDDHYNLDDKEARALLDGIAVQAKRAAQAGVAAERGTHTHELTEDFDTERDWVERARAGEELGIPADVQQSLVDAWEQMLTDEDLEILAVEARVVDDDWRQAGSLDRIGRLRRARTFQTAAGDVTLPAGWVGILDVKTGRIRIGPDGHPDHWLGYAVQIASYAKAKPYDPATRTRSEWPWPIDQDWGIIAHLDVLSALAGRPVCRLVLVDLAAGRHAGALCVAGREWEKRRDVFSYVQPAPVSPVEPAEQPAAVDAPTEPDPPVDVNPPLTAEPANPLAGIVCMRGRCNLCKRTVNLANHDCTTAPPAPAHVPDVIADQAARQADRRGRLVARYQALSDDSKLAYQAIRPADTDDHDAVSRALDAVTPPAILAAAFVTSIVGVSFAADYPAAIHRLAAGQPLTLARDRNNPHDVNAVAVHTLGGVPLGHLPRPVAATLARRLDEHEHWSATVDTVGGPADQPGVIIECRQTETRDRRAALAERYALLSDDQKRAYRKPADTSNLDAVAAAIDAVDPFAAIAEPHVTPAPASTSAEPAVAALDEGGGFADQYAIDSLQLSFTALTTEQKLQCATITAQARDAGTPISVTASPTLRRWHIARAIISWIGAGHTSDDILCAAVTITTLEQTRGPDDLGALLGTFTIAQADSLYDALDQPAAV